MLGHVNAAGVLPDHPIKTARIVPPILIGSIHDVNEAVRETDRVCQIPTLNRAIVYRPREQQYLCLLRVPVCPIVDWGFAERFEIPPKLHSYLLCCAGFLVLVPGN